MRLRFYRHLLATIRAVRYKKINRARLLFGLCIACCLLFYILFFVILADGTIIDYQYLGAVDESVLKNRVDFHEVMIDRVCSKTTARCYNIFDRKLSKEGAVEVVERQLFVEGFAEDSDTAVRLIAPRGELFDDSDTRIWQIDHFDIRSQYVAGMLVAPFLVSALSTDSSDVGKTVLEIGLGGGSFDMFLHKLKPKVNITAIELDSVVVETAKKWFGVVEEENHRVIVQDGLEYLKEASKRGKKSDVIALDACDEAIRSPCPAKVFRDVEVIERLKNALTPTGCLIVNVLSEDADETPTSAQKIANLFYSVFPTCIRMKMVKETNVILLCMPYAISNVRQQITFYNSRLKTVTSYLKLDNIFDKISIA
ncbi:unnamed protein product [Cylicocyclus nassatus]|uniref:Methyltransferase-like protein 13 n=1 Tax=Cylicocyclus nassatus TaxID=53992 RepID=A0AA36DLG6_CYLNA|nr:unnamed protein product [Cylicocyclus nassatus]